MNKLNFCKSFIYLGKGLISFDRRPYLPAIYRSTADNLVLRCSRQTEKSTFLGNTILFEACMNPGIQMLFVSPRFDQAKSFIHVRVIRPLAQSPLVRRRLLGRSGRNPKITHLQFVNGSSLFVRAAYHSGDACRGLSADLLLVDEFQDVAEGDLPVLQETLSHAQRGRTILTGTPKSIDNHLEAVFRRSTANQWVLDCPGCGQGVILDERSLGPHGVACPGCGAALDPQTGRWQARNPQATGGDGFWICHPMVPWLNYDKILERQQTYDLMRFKNEVLGLSTTAGDAVVTLAELEACCRDYPLAQSLEEVPPDARRRLVAGIDWGGGGTSRTVLTLGYMRSDYVFQVLRWERFAATDDPQWVVQTVAEICNRFQVKLVAADSGNGHVVNRMLVDKLAIRGLCAIVYSASDHEPRRDGVLIKWTVNRTASIGVLFSRIKMQKILFPRKEVCGSLLDEFACETAEYDSTMRTIQYVHPESQQDDALHATNYALLLATWVHAKSNWAF